LTIVSAKLADETAAPATASATKAAIFVIFIQHSPVGYNYNSDCNSGCNTRVIAASQQ
jgi:hypothetical protein